MESMVSSTKIIQVFFEVNMETNFDNEILPEFMVSQAKRKQIKLDATLVQLYNNIQNGA